MGLTDGRMFRALRHRAFRMLWGSSLFFQVGYWFSVVGLQLIVARASGNDPLALGLLYFGSLLPYLLLSLPLGAIADSRDRGALLTGAQLFGAALAVICTLLAVADQLTVPVIIGVAFLGGATSATVSAAAQGLTPNIVPAHDVTSAIPLYATALNVARVAGPALAGLVLLVSGPSSTFAVWALVWCAAAFLARRIPQVTTQPVARHDQSVFKHLTAGVAHTAERPPARAALAIVAATSFFGSTYQAQLPVIAANLSPDSERAFILLVVLGGIGALIGVLGLASGEGNPTVRGAAAQLVVLGITVAVLGNTHSLVAGGIAAVACGGLVFSTMTSINTILQQLVADAFRGRVMSLYFICWGGLLPFGGLALGALVDRFGTGPSLAAFGAVALLAGLVIARSTPPVTDGLRPAEG